MDRGLFFILFIIFVLNGFWMSFFLESNLLPDIFSGKIEEMDILKIEKIVEYLRSKIFKINEIQFNFFEEGRFYILKVNQYDVLSWFRS